MKKNTIRLNETQLKKIISECVKKILGEAFSSRILKRLADEHGGIKASSEYVDLAELTDDDLKHYGLTSREKFEREHPSAVASVSNGEDRYRIIYFNDDMILYDKRAEWGSEHPWQELTDREMSVYKKRKGREGGKDDEYTPLNKEYKKKMGYR